MSAIKSTIFRVTGLPNGPEEQIISDLKEVLHHHASTSELQRLGKISIVASCYDDHTSVALLEWKGDTPDFLYRLVTSPFSSWEIDLDDADISFDRHFLGFTQLYNTIPERPVHAESVLDTSRWELCSYANSMWQYYCSTRFGWPRIWLIPRKGQSRPNMASGFPLQRFTQLSYHDLWL